MSVGNNTGRVNEDATILLHHRLGSIVDLLWNAVVTKLGVLHGGLSREPVGSPEDHLDALVDPRLDHFPSDLVDILEECGVIVFLDPGAASVVWSTVHDNCIRLTAGCLSELSNPLTEALIEHGGNAIAVVGKL